MSVSSICVTQVEASAGELAVEMLRLLHASGRDEFDDCYVECAQQEFIEEIAAIADAAIWLALDIEDAA